MSRFAKGQSPQPLALPGRLGGKTLLRIVD